MDHCQIQRHDVTTSLNTCMDKPVPPEILERITWNTRDSDTPKVKSIQHEPKPCDDCGIIATDRRVNITVNQGSAHTLPHVKIKCQNCGLYRSPKTGIFEMNYPQIQVHFLRKKKSKD